MNNGFLCSLRLSRSLTLWHACVSSGGLALVADNDRRRTCIANVTGLTRHRVNAAASVLMRGYHGLTLTRASPLARVRSCVLLNQRRGAVAVVHLSILLLAEGAFRIRVAAVRYTQYLGMRCWFSYETSW
jgi:hypothetical protein